MGLTERVEKHKILREIPFINAFFRGLFAVFLGILLWINPDKSRVLLANFMGFFWLSSGFLLLFKQSEEASQVMGKRTSLIVGVVAVVGGLLVVSRRVTEKWLDQTLLVQVLGIVIILTGVMHIFGEYRAGLQERKGYRLAHLILGIFEVILGAMLLISPLSYGPLTYLVATIWALVGGVTITGTAVYERIKARKQKQESLQT